MSDVLNVCICRFFVICRATFQPKKAYTCNERPVCVYPVLLGFVAVKNNNSVRHFRQKGDIHAIGASFQRCSLQHVYALFLKNVTDGVTLS